MAIVRQVLDSDPKHLKIAFADLAAGVAEIPGAANHPRIMQAFIACGHPEIKSEATPWCAAFAGLCLSEADLPIPPTKINLTAGSYEQYGVAVDLASAKRGDVCVFYRGSRTSWERHVFFYLGHNKTHIYGVGGNQWDAKRQASVAVTISAMKRGDLTAVRRPVAATKKDLRDAGSTEMQLAQNMKKVAVGGGIATGAAGAVQDLTTPSVIPPEAIVAPPPISLDAIKTGAEQTGYVRTIGEGAAAVGKLLIDNPWIFAAMVILSGIVFYAYRIESKRMVRHKAGLPISTQLDADIPDPEPEV